MSGALLSFSAADRTLRRYLLSPFPSPPRDATEGTPGRTPYEYGTHKTVKAKFWYWLSGKSC